MATKKYKRPPRNKSPQHKRRMAGIAIRRRMLIAAMGGACEDCGTTGTKDNGLEFHHTQPRTWFCRDTSRHLRQRLYEDEWDQGLLILLCSYCNKVRGQPVNESEESQVPF